MLWLLCLLYFPFSVLFIHSNFLRASPRLKDVGILTFPTSPVPASAAEMGAGCSGSCTLVCE